MAAAMEAAAVRPPAKLKDPLNNRQMTEVPLPAAEIMTEAQFWTPEGKPRLDVLQEHLLAEGALSQELLLDIISRARDEFQAEPNMLKLRDPITVVGDIHGQFYDLRQLFDLGGSWETASYLFLGDYVDRGSFSIEVVTFLYALKISCPSRFRMLRGNHESRQMTSFFNFRQECEYKYDPTVYEAVMESFDCLPFAATVNGQFFCVHGGLSPELRHLNDLIPVDRFQEPPFDGLLCDLLWSDPTDRSLSRSDQFVPNETRGCAYHFGYTCTVNFLRENKLLSLFRAHEVQLEGYKMHKTNPRTQFPSVITVFSAPNYSDTYGNRAAVLMLDNSTLNVKQFHFTQHPYHLTDFMNVFELSLPFMAEKVMEILSAICIPEEEEEEAPEAQPEASDEVPMWTRSSLSSEQNLNLQLVERLMALSGQEMPPEIDDSKEAARNRIRQKALVLGRLAKVYRTRREEHELIVKLKGVCPGHRLAPGLLLEGKERIKSEFDLYAHSEALDRANEKRPEAAS